MTVFEQKVNHFCFYSWFDLYTFIYDKNFLNPYKICLFFFSSLFHLFNKESSLNGPESKGFGSNIGGGGEHGEKHLSRRVSLSYCNVFYLYM